MVTTKKAMVVVLMAVLGSSVLVGALSLYNRTSTATPTTVVENQSILNSRLNSVVDFCIKSLPKGIPACDKQLKDLVLQVCSTNNGQLDACHNGEVNRYYAARTAEASRSISNKTH